MGRLGRFFVNRFKGRANERLFRWIRQSLVLREGSECLELGAGKAAWPCGRSKPTIPRGTLRRTTTLTGGGRPPVPRRGVFGRFAAKPGASNRGRLATRFPRGDLRRGLRLRDAPSRRR